VSQEQLPTNRSAIWTPLGLNWKLLDKNPTKCFPMCAMAYLAKCFFFNFCVTQSFITVYTKAYPEPVESPGHPYTIFLWTF